MQTQFKNVMVAWVAAACLLLTPALAVEYFVAPDGADSNDGSSWNQAFATISNALVQVGVDTVTVSNGTYTLETTLAVTNGVTIQSFGNGVTGGLANAEYTIVQRTGGTGGGKFRICGITHTNAVLDGLTITGGMGRGVHGFGVNMTGGTVRNCIVRDNGDLWNASAAGKASGGGIYMTGGVVSNCIVQGNAVVEDYAAGIYARGVSRIVDSRILDNRHLAGYNCSGGGVYASGGGVLVRNCLVAGNVVKGNGGGIYGGTVESCTVVNNRSRSTISQGGGTYGASVINSVVLQNETGSGVPSVANYEGGNFSYSCADPLASGAGNVDYTEFVDLAGSNYQLRAGAAVDAGSNAAWMTNALDVAGSARLNGVDNVVDMGAYEKVPSALECGFSASSTSVGIASNVVFTALPFGTNLNITSAAWVFGDGQAADGLTVTNAYSAAGNYTVSLQVGNDSGENATASYTNYMTVWGTLLYVATNSPAPMAPYHTWSNAAQSVKGATDAAPSGSVVVLSNGTYEVVAELVIDRPMTICGFTDGVCGGLLSAAATVVRRPLSNPQHRVLQITDPGVVLDGLTVSGGRKRGAPGQGIQMTGGVVRNCIVRENGSSSTGDAGLADGGGVWMNGGVVSNCTVEANVIPEGNGVGIRAQGSAKILNCRIIDNTKVAAQYPKSGGGIYATSSSVLIRNCLVARNTSNTSGGGIYGGTVANCTVVSNGLTSVSADGGGVYLTGGSTVSNSIVYFNTVSGVHSNLNTTAGVGYSCFTNPDDLSNGNIADDPLFVDLAGDAFRTSDLSPCINRGDSSIVDWATDLDGNPRIKGVVDMGCYELQPPAGCVFVVR